ncbi:MAG: GNAT family N-acetyltransferase [Actinomycetota bacterium]
MIHEVVRALRAGDSSELGELESSARAAMSPQRGGAAHLAELTAVGDWSTLIDRDDRSVIVATVDELVVGYLELELDGAVARVRQVYVRPEARELGLGDGMLAAATEAAIGAGCTVLEGVALPGDRDTKNLYERAGIVARKIVVSRRL